jgi:hypothetical protein
MPCQHIGGQTNDEMSVHKYQSSEGPCIYTFALKGTWLAILSTTLVANHIDPWDDQMPQQQNAAPRSRHRISRRVAIASIQPSRSKHESVVAVNTAGSVLGRRGDHPLSVLRDGALSGTKAIFAFTPLP